MRYKKTIVVEYEVVLKVKEGSDLVIASHHSVSNQNAVLN